VWLFRREVQRLWKVAIPSAVVSWTSQWDRCGKTVRFSRESIGIIEVNLYKNNGIIYGSVWTLVVPL
jgi:hypothetical protein